MEAHAEGFVSVPATVLLFDLSAGGGVHGVAQTVAPKVWALSAIWISPLPVVPGGDGWMRTRKSDSPAPLPVVEKRSVGSVAFL